MISALARPSTTSCPSEAMAEKLNTPRKTHRNGVKKKGFKP